MIGIKFFVLSEFDLMINKLFCVKVDVMVFLIIYVLMFICIICIVNDLFIRFEWFVLVINIFLDEMMLFISCLVLLLVIRVVVCKSLFIIVFKCLFVCIESFLICNKFFYLRSN